MDYADRYGKDKIESGGIFVRDKSRVISMVLAIFMIIGLLPADLIEAAGVDWIEYVDFSTDHKEKYISPSNRRIDNQENVAINPVIKIKFRNELDPSKLVKSRVKLKSNDGDYFVLDEEDMWINHNDHTDPADRAELGGKVLKIDLNTVLKSGKYPLRKNTLYKLTLEKGAVSLIKPDIRGDKTNEEIDIHFITGKNEGQITFKNNLGVNRYSSDKTPNDNITNLIDTKLGSEESSIGRDGKSIYIHMDEEIRWNTDKLTNNSNSSVNDKISLNKEYFKHFKFYRLPKAYETEAGGKIDKEMRYDTGKNVQFKPGEKMVELDIESIDILTTGNKNSKILKITPKEDLRFYNMHYLKLDDSNIITDIYGRKLKENIDKYIWTTNRNTNEVPNWVLDDSGDPYSPYDPNKKQIRAEEIINNTNTPSNKSVATWRLYGVPKYNEHIDIKDKEKPIILYVDDEVIPNPKYYPKTHPNVNSSAIYNDWNLSNIVLREEHGVAGRDRHEIKWYKLEYYKDYKGKIKTKISLYPKGELDAGKPYELKVSNEAFVTRNGKEMSDSLNLKFIIEGEQAKKRGIYSVGYTGSLSIYDASPSLKLDIKGFNFTEDIRNIRLTNTVTGQSILLNKSDFDINFINVDHMEVTLRLSGLNKIRRKGYGGTYGIYIGFGGGSGTDTAGPVGSGNNIFTIYERPYVLDTFPKANDLKVVKEELFTTLEGGKSGNYLTVEFDNIGGMLKACGTTEIDDFVLSDEAGNSLIDREKQVVFEGLQNVPTNKSEITVEAMKKDVVALDGTSAKLYLDDDRYQIGDKMKITLFDEDLKGKEATVQVTIENQDRTVKLTELGKNSGKFEGEIEIWKVPGENSETIQVKYIDEQTAMGPVNRPIEVEAKIVKRVDYKRTAQIYVDKAVYEKDENIKTTVLDKGKAGMGHVQVKYIDPDVSDYSEQTLYLVEQGINTGIFESQNKLAGISNKFKIKYSYTERPSQGISGKVKVYIPLTDEMQDGKTYVAKFPAGVVCYGDSEITDDDKRGNQEYEWSFKTGEAVDLNINVSGDFKGSVPEEYDPSYPIVLTGERLTDGLTVFFKDNLGKEYQGQVKALKGNDKILHVFLPSGRNKLPVGLYNIVVRNTKGVEETIRYGVLSVVSKGDYKPNEDHKVKDTEINGDPVKGDLKEISKTSKNEIELGSKHISQSLDLDSILGEQVLIREIKYDGSSISTLDTKSKWADIKLKGLKRESTSQPMIIRLGRAEPMISDGIKKKLIGDSVKSDFIQISGTNYGIDSAELSIPYRESNGNGLKVLRYDEDTRRIDKNISFRVDKSNKKVIITNAGKGIFVIVQ